MLTKEKVINSIKELPDTFSLDEIIDRIVLLSKIEIGIEQTNNGEVISDDELEKRLGKWLV